MSPPALVLCPHCQGKLRLPASLSPAKKIKCPRCQTIFSPYSGSHVRALSRAASPKAAPKRARSPVPKKPKLSSHPLLLASLIVAVVIVGGGIIAWGLISVYKGLDERAVEPILAKTFVPPPSPWLQDFKAAQQKAAEEKKDILVSFEGSDWNTMCRQMRGQVLGTFDFTEKAVLPDQTSVYRSIESMIQHFELVMPNRQWKPPVDEVYAATESPNGELGFYLVSDGTGVAYRARTRPPSFIHFAVFPYLIVGHLLSDVVAVLGSLNIIAAELDR